MISIFLNCNFMKKKQHKKTRDSSFLFDFCCNPTNVNIRFENFEFSMFISQCCSKSYSVCIFCWDFGIYVCFWKHFKSCQNTDSNFLTFAWNSIGTCTFLKTICWETTFSVWSISAQMWKCRLKQDLLELIELVDIWKLVRFDFEKFGYVQKFLFVWKFREARLIDFCFLINSEVGLFALNFCFLPIQDFVIWKSYQHCTKTPPSIQNFEIAFPIAPKGLCDFLTRTVLLISRSSPCMMQPCFDNFFGQDAISILGALFNIKTTEWLLNKLISRALRANRG